MNASRYLPNTRSISACLGALAVTLLFGSGAGTVCQAAGTVVAWGANDANQCQVPSGLSNIVSVAGGQSHSLALRGDGIVFAWGFDLSGQATVPAGLTNVTAITAGSDFSAALKNDGKIVVWGGLPAAPADLTNVTAIAAGQDHCLALTADNKVRSWGSMTDVPAGLANVVAIAAGNGFSMALKADTTVTVWGTNSYTVTGSLPALTNIMSLAAGSDHALALRRDFKVLAWGRNDYLQATVPSALTNAIAIGGGARHSIALRPDGSILAWGDNTYNQTAITPTVTGFAALAAGGYHSLAIKGDNYPSIIVQPASQDVIVTKSVTLTVVATGARPLTYQWQHYGTNLFNQTNVSLTLANFQFSDGGPYSVLVANAYGAVLSGNAILNPVIQMVPPTFTTQPKSVLTICGQTATFTAAASGPPPIGYQWQFQGALIDGATATAFVVTNITTAQAGPYALVATNLYGAVTSSVATLSLEPPYITSALTASGTQGQPFSYTIIGKHGPKAFGATYMPFGLTVNPTNGLISGTPQEFGTFGVTIAAFSPCSSDVKTLVLTIAPSLPVITSAAATNGTEGTPLVYRITATKSPTSFAADNLPVGLMVDGASGLISGSPVLAGEYDSTISASNQWGVGSANLHFSIANAVPPGLSISGVSYSYSSPYLLDFEFSLRDDNNPTNAGGVLTEPRLLSAVCMEDGVPISSSETAQLIARGSSKLLKAYLVLDFTESIATLLNGDTNNDGISDAVDNMVNGAQYFVDHKPADAQVGVYEFHREDFDPQQVVALTPDKQMLDQKIAGIWTNYVQGFAAGSRCWDALAAAIRGIGTNSPYEQHYVIFVSDGNDESSANTVNNVIALANTNSVKVYAIAFGNPVNASTLQQITDATGGRFYQAASSGDLWTKFSLISKDLQGQYILRWATLKRNPPAFLPSFQISYMGLTATFTPSDIVTNWSEVDTNTTPPTTNQMSKVIGHTPPTFMPTNYGPASAVVTGAVRLELNAEVLPTAVTLRAHYIPRYITQMRFHYRPNWPCTASIQSTNTGEILEGWSLIETNDDSGGRWLTLVSPNPMNSLTSVKFAAFGPLVTFTFADVINSSNAFSFFDADNSIYPTNAGSQRFVLDQNSMVTSYPVLPFGTPVPWLIAAGYTSPGTSNAWAQAELEDIDSDGVLNWQEYRANTDPKDPASKLFIRSVVRQLDGRSQIVFASSSNRYYAVQGSTDLVTWTMVQDKIPGNSSDITVIDTRYVPGATNMYYRVMVY